jgi:3-oxoacyl-[acyl-carrier-protein] synthase-1
MSNKVFVTGAGIISAIGVGVDATLQSIINGKSGIGKVSYLSTEHNEIPVGEVPLSNTKMSQMLSVEYPTSELRTVLLGIFAAKEAVTSAKLTAADIAKTAFISGTTVGGMDKTEQHIAPLIEGIEHSAECMELKYNDCGYSTELIADAIGKFSSVTTTSTACSSAANAIILGANMIKAGIIDIAVVGGSEALTKFHLNGFNSLMILDKERCRPFDKNRAGINLGEGAGYIVIESESSALRRKANIIGILSGYGNACDAFHQTASSENGEGAFLAMRSALQMSGLSPEEIDYINAHGTGTQNNDITELTAMKRIWNDHLPQFSSTKAFTGHTTSASGAIEAVICLLAINHGFLPPNLGLEEAIQDIAVPITTVKVGINVKNVVDNSFGFGGNDSSLIFSKYNKPL